MSQIIVDDELRAKLNGLLDGTELLDAGGKPLGYLVSPQRYRDLVFAWMRWCVSDAEIDSARQQEGGRSLQEILTDLEGR